MRGVRIDCVKPALSDHPTDSGTETCKWCGRPVKWIYTSRVAHKSKLVHCRGYRRMHPDPRKEATT
jgi:hypothetical protein